MYILYDTSSGTLPVKIFAQINVFKLQYAGYDMNLFLLVSFIRCLNAFDN